MTFEEKLDLYAELLVSHGLNVQPGQVVQISTEAIHRDLAVRVAEKAYARGAKLVEVDLADARLGRIRVERSSGDDLAYVPEYLTTKYRDLVDGTAANLKIIGSEDPDVLTGLDPKSLNTLRISRYKAVKYFYDEGIGKSKVHWTVAAAATPAWGLKLFPDASPDEACNRLWDEIFRICRADTPDCLALWKAHNDRLGDRASALTAMGISELHFTGPGTDLMVRLSPKAVFKGGGDTSPRDVMFEPNIPTEEVFTTPDYRGTSGKVRTTRPFLINGTMIKDLEVEFESGTITSFSAAEGEAVFAEYIDSDAGARRLGEVALVGIDSPVYRSGLVFEEILFDENAACHIAVGSAYKFCLDGGENMTAEELEELGCNESSAHTDMMISSEEVDVTATTHAGETVALMKGGEWVIG